MPRGSNDGARQAHLSTITIRQAMESREGAAAVAFAERRGLRVWVVERFDWHRPEIAMVFGTCRSDAVRRAQAPARLGESYANTEWRTAEVVGKWDEPFVWPLAPREDAA